MKIENRTTPSVVPKLKITEEEIEEMAHSLRIRKLDNEKIGFDVLSRLSGNAYEDEETSIARYIITQLGYRKQTNVAERIFEELKDLAKIHVLPVVREGMVDIEKEPFWCIDPADFAKLEKKYTEDTV